MAIHRYFRLLVTGYPAGWGGADQTVNIADMKIRNSIGTVLTSIYGGTPSASVGDAGAYAAFDGNTASYDSWGAYTVPEWIKWDFGAGNEQEAVDVQLFLGWGIGTFKIQQSDDNLTWTDRYSSAGGLTTGSYHTLTLSYEVPTPTNNAPIITSDGGDTSISLYVAENTTAVTTVTATDADSDTLTYSISGADASFFNIDSSTGVVAFNTAPDFETPLSSYGNNLYEVIVTVSDGTDSDSQTLYVNVINAGPAFTNNGGGNDIAVSVAENTTAVTTVVSGGASFAITGGDDAALFQINGVSGELSFIDAPDYELPADTNSDNDYIVIVSGSVGGETAYQTLTVTVTDVVAGVGVESFPGTNWTPVITIDSVDVSASITGQVSVEAEEATSRVASFLLRPDAGSISAGDWLGANITIDYKTVTGSGVTVSQNRIFTGVVDQAIYDPNTRLVSFDCTDDMQGKLEAMTQAEIDALIVNSRWSDAVFGDYKDGWQYFENISGTYPQSYDYNADGVTGTLVDWAAKEAADFSYDASSIIDQSISYSISPRRELFNSYTINYSYRFGRLLHRDHQFTWALRFCPYHAKGHDLPTREMITAAAMNAGWNLTSKISFTGLPPTSADPCNTGVGWARSEFAKETFVLGALWKASKRWTQDVTEDYVITVNAPQSITWLGTVAYEESASNQSELDADGWSDGVATPAGRINSQNDIVQDKYDRTISDKDIETLIARARTEILASHRSNFVSAGIELNPIIERFHTVRLEANGITGQGKVSKFTHVMDIDSGQAISTIEIAISFNGGEAGTGDDTITAPSAPNTDPITAAPSAVTTLDTNLGGDDGVADYDDAWDGFTANYSVVVGTPTEAQFYDRQFKVATPDINQDAVDAISGESTSTYSFDIPDELLVITVA